MNKGEIGNKIDDWNEQEIKHYRDLEPLVRGEMGPGTQGSINDALNKEELYEKLNTLSLQYNSDLERINETHLQIKDVVRVINNEKRESMEFLDIKFKARRIDNGEWIEGNYHHNIRKGRWHAISSKDDNESHKIYRESLHMFQWGDEWKEI